METALFSLFAVGLSAAAGYFVPRWQAKRRQLESAQVRAALAAQAATLTAAAKQAADSQRAQAETEALALREKRRTKGLADLDARRAKLQVTTEQIQGWDVSLLRSETQLAARAETLKAREAALSVQAERQRAAQVEQKQTQSEAKDLLQRQAGETFVEAKQRLITEWTEQVRAERAEALRQIEHEQNTPDVARQGRRLLDISSQRYHGHYLTERLLSNLPIEPALAGQIGGKEGEGFLALSEVANVKVTLSDDQANIRLEGQDSFGREIARRTLARMIKNPARCNPDAIRRQAQQINEELERETVELGRRAFRELEIPRAHPDIVKLVGRLNFRTSYSQNQWKHAVEAAFLCGMIASELSLDVKIARRAALMHDIGKSLTHAIDGSHAVIGADFARRLGEAEIVANAIGAHHLDEPFQSAYAYLVAATDAMSGARPGARHEQEGSFVHRVDELERLVHGTRGVDRVYALQAGREVRIYVKENEVDDLRATQLSAQLADHISKNLVFPGQIKVTVIREVNAVAVAN